MKANVKKIASLALTVALVSSVAACGKKKSDSKALEAAETLLNATVTLNTKKIKKLDKEIGLDEDSITYLQELAEVEGLIAIYSNASYEIDSESLEEDKDSASVDVTITMPDCEAAYDDCDGDFDTFLELIEDQKKKDYTSFDVTIEFDVEDGEYTIANTDEYFETLFEPVTDLPSDFVMGSNSTEEPADTTPAETDHIDTTPAETDPVDTTPAETDPVNTTPAETTAPASPSGTSYIDFNNMHFYVNDFEVVLGKTTLQDLIDAGCPFDAEDIAELPDTLEGKTESFGIHIVLDEYNNALIEVMNDSDSAKPFKECFISSIYVPVDQDEPQNVIRFDFPFSMTQEDLVANAGETEDYSHYESEESDFYTDTYEYRQDAERFSGDRFYCFDFTRGELDSITLRYLP